MKKFFDAKMILIYVLVVSLFITLPIAGNHAISALSETDIARTTVVIDAGHGGVDGGAVSCTGIYESHINLQIAQKLNDLMHLLGIRTIMIRESDRSVYTYGNSIAEKKISDIHQRIKIVNTTPRALLISIHQNTFPDSRYSGAQVFYNSQPGSEVLAQNLQTSLQENLTANNTRKIKKTTGIYLMEHVNCTGVLVECGFISNYDEEQLLRDERYQQKISAVIATTVSEYLNT